MRLTAIRIDGDTQPRVAIDEKVVADYAELIEAGVELPPIHVYVDKQMNYWLADGFHRWHAHRRARRTEILCDIRRGTVEDARWHSFAANQAHGLRRSNADKRKAVEAALKHPKAKKMSDRRVANHVGVSQPFVSKLRAKPTPPTGQSDNGYHSQPDSGGREITDAAAVQLSGTKVADNRRELEKLATLDDDTQLEVARRIGQGKAKSVDEAMAHRSADAITTSSKPVEVREPEENEEPEPDEDRAMFLDFGKRVIDWILLDVNRQRIALIELRELITLVEETAGQ